MIIDEQISVNLLDNQVSGFVWRTRAYRVSKTGLHHTFYEGSTLVHIFSLTDGNSFFKLHFNTDTLRWKLLEIAYV